MGVGTALVIIAVILIALAVLLSPVFWALLEITVAIVLIIIIIAALAIVLSWLSRRSRAP